MQKFRSICICCVIAVNNQYHATMWSGPGHNSYNRDKPHIITITNVSHHTGAGWGNVSHKLVAVMAWDV